MEKPPGFSQIVVITIAVILAAGYLAACAVSQKVPEKTETPACLLPPDSFSESDLIGTWVAEYNGGTARDTLIIRKDGTYKQSFMVTLAASLDFESDWKRWWIERRPSGYIRVHLQGMRKCDDIESICGQPSGGVSSMESAIDDCEGQTVIMPDEVVLIVAGYPVPVPRGIVLRQTRLAGSEWSYAFKLQK